jgi:hypothetical protein
MKILLIKQLDDDLAMKKVLAKLTRPRKYNRTVYSMSRAVIYLSRLLPPGNMSSNYNNKLITNLKSAMKVKVTATKCLWSRCSNLQLGSLYGRTQQITETENDGSLLSPLLSPAWFIWQTLHSTFLTLSHSILRSIRPTRHQSARNFISYLANKVWLLLGPYWLRSYCPVFACVGAWSYLSLSLSRSSSQDIEGYAAIPGQ